MKSFACGDRNVNRAVFAGRTGSSYSGAYSARPSAFVVTTSARPLRIHAGAARASSTRCTDGRTRFGLVLRRRAPG